MPRTNPSPESALFTEDPLSSYHNHAADHLARCIDAHEPNPVEIREHLFSCFKYPEQIQSFLNQSAPVPELSPAFLRAGHAKNLDPFIEELRTSAEACLPSHPARLDNPADPFRGLYTPWMNTAYTVPPVTLDLRGRPNDSNSFVILSQILIPVIEPNLAGTCTFVVLSPSPLMGPLSSGDVRSTSEWIKDNVTVEEGNHVRLFSHRLPQHGNGEALSLEKIFLSQNRSKKNQPLPLGKLATHRPTFIDRAILEAMNTYFGTWDDESGRDPFSMYLQDHFSDAQSNRNVKGMDSANAAHLDHTLRRMRTALSPYTPPDIPKTKSKLSYH